LEVIHRSSGRQDPEVFLFTGESALNPKKSSSYLEKKFSEGCKETSFLIDYAIYKGSIYDNDAVDSIALELFEKCGVSLSDKRMWTLFTMYVKGNDNPLFKEMVANRAKYVKLYGVEQVDKKMYKEFQYSAKSMALLKSMPEFDGKEVLVLLGEANALIYANKYQESFKYLDSLMSYHGKFSQDVCRSLYFISRSTLYGDNPKIWIEKCFELSRFVAYNNPDRDDASVHYDYAVQLEKRLNGLQGGKMQQPAFGQESYSMRPLDLKQKPSKKR
jgi:hypothetical protein